MDNLNEQAGKLLKQYNFRQTATRLSVLRSFLESSHALSHQCLETILGAHFDRVTIYRTLISFIDAGILHKIPDSAGSPKYALCGEGNCHAGNHQDHHIHFACNQCKQTFCIEETIIPQIQIPPCYIISKVNFLVEGICKDCSESQIS